MHFAVISLVATLAYLVLVRFLRYRWVQSLPRRFHVSGRADLGQLSVDDAYSIVKEMIELEFPHMMGLSIGFALFKTYGIPEISSLLTSTGQLHRPETISKRVADTGTLILEFVLNPPSSERRLQAITRMNWLHGRYQRSGKLQNPELLYTLALFAIEPLRWIPKHEWRDLTDLERCAHGMLWKSIGDSMGIEYTVLPSALQSSDDPQAGSWKDGLQWLEELAEWSETYEKQHQRFAETNKRLSYANIDLLMFNIPSESFKQAGRLFYSTLLSDELRSAIQFPEPSSLTRRLVFGVLQTRKFLIRHCFLPRYNHFFRRTWIAPAPNKETGSINMVEWITFPWYVQPTVWRRVGPHAWMTWLAGGVLPGDDVKYSPEGFKALEVGPDALRGKGKEEMSANLAVLRGAAAESRCPFSSTGLRATDEVLRPS